VWPVERMGEGRNVCKYLVGKPKKRNHSEDRRGNVRMGSNRSQGDWLEGRVEWIHLAPDRPGGGGL
jgi:hypothetical protein